jgi:4-amino-4-deoxy-L-arabinose transferase-like glycosyltransferase
MVLRDPYFALGLVLGLLISLAWFYLARSSALAAAARRDHDAYQRGRRELVAEQSGAHVHCEPGAPVVPNG